MTTVSNSIPISEVLHPTPSTVAQQQAARAATGSTLDKDAFMKLLITQMKYQNPLEPTDPAAFMSTMTQMTTVEKLTQIADSATQQVDGQRSLSAASLIARQIEWKATDGSTKAGTVTGTKFTVDGPILIVGTEEVPFNTVLAVTQANAG